MINMNLRNGNSMFLPGMGDCLNRTTQRMIISVIALDSFLNLSKESPVSHDSILD